MTMKFQLISLFAMASITCSNAFQIASPLSKAYVSRSFTLANVRAASSLRSSLLEISARATSSTTKTSRLSMTVEEDRDNEIERLQTMAAKLRAEAASLEAEQAEVIAVAAEKAFRKFDTNQDGEISLAELKAGLEKEFKTELPDKRVEQVMIDFDKSGDGALQLDEFVSVEVFRNRLEALAREEKAMALEKAKQAKVEEEASKLLEAQLSLINDGTPTPQDKVLSVIPYLFPLMDGLQFGRFLLLENADNILAATLAILYGLYRSIPFSGFIAFFALSFLSGNPSINRLIRYNMQQAIFLDIALFFPGLIGAFYAVIAQGVGGGVPAGITELGSGFLFVSLLAVLAYCVGSSLLGQTPNKLPIISPAVDARMPTVDMFDPQGRFRPEQKKKDDDDK